MANNSNILVGFFYVETEIDINIGKASWLVNMAKLKTTYKNTTEGHALVLDKYQGTETN